MDETIYVLFKAQFDFALEVWFSIFSTVHGCGKHYVYHYKFINFHKVWLCSKCNTLSACYYYFIVEMGHLYHHS